MAAILDILMLWHSSSLFILGKEIYYSCWCPLRTGIKTFLMFLSYGLAQLERTRIDATAIYP